MFIPPPLSNHLCQVLSPHGDWLMEALSSGLPDLEIAVRGVRRVHDLRAQKLQKRGCWKAASCGWSAGGWESWTI